jgi:hypothetical protein
MVVFEDLHWADQSTLDLAAFLVQALRAVPVLLELTYRSDELHRGHRLRPLLAAWERVRSIEHVVLRRFGREEAAGGHRPRILSSCTRCWDGSSSTTGAGRRGSSGRDAFDWVSSHSAELAAHLA